MIVALIVTDCSLSPLSSQVRKRAPVTQRYRCFGGGGSTQNREPQEESLTYGGVGDTRKGLPEEGTLGLTLQGGMWEEAWWRKWESVPSFWK